MAASANQPIVALTGATGFIGRHLLRELPKRGYRLRVLLRRPSELPEGAASAVVGDLRRPINMAAALADADAVIHSAGLAHGMSGLPEDDFRALNTDATLALARAAEKAHVRRFVFLSSIRAQTGPTSDAVIDERRPAVPTDAYGRSKLAAEQGLATLDMDWVALRPVLVYGPGVKGNMARFVSMAGSPWPLPFGGLRGRRSLLSVDNLVDAIDAVLAAPAPLRQPFVVADRDALTAAEMLAALRRGFGRRSSLFPVPESWLATASRAVGQGEAFERLAGSLLADPSALTQLGWRPTISSREGLAALAREWERP